MEMEIDLRTEVICYINLYYNIIKVELEANTLTKTIVFKRQIHKMFQ